MSESGDVTLKNGCLRLSRYRSCGATLHVTADPSAAHGVEEVFLAVHADHGCVATTARRAAAVRARAERLEAGR